MKASERTIRLIVKDGIDYCFCAREKEYKPCTEFSARKNDKIGFQYYCRKCSAIVCNTGTASKRDLVIANQLLELIGYNPTDNESIHQQFIKRHYDAI